MKKFAVALAVLALAGVQTGWSGVLGLNNIKSDASIEVKGIQANNEVDNLPANDRRGETVTRLRLGASADIVDNVSGRLELLRATGQFGQGPSSAQTEQDKWSFQNAYVRFAELFTLQNVTLGRQYAGRRGDLLAYFGPINDDALSTRALDGLSAVRMLGPVRAEFVTAKVVENQAVSQTEATPPATTSDVNITWANFRLDPTELSSMKGKSDFRLPLEVGIYQGSNGNGSGVVTDNQNLIIYDLRASVIINNAFDIGAQFAMNDGQRNAGATAVDYAGSAFVIHAKYDDAQNGFGLGFNFANATGDDDGGNEDDAFHDYFILGAGGSDYRYGEIISNSNAFVANNGLGVGLDTGSFGDGLNIISLAGYFTLPWDAKKWTVDAGYYMVQFNEAATGVDDGFGNEIDLALGYRYSDNVSMRAGYAHFDPDFGNRAPAAADEATSKLFASLAIKFGANVDERPF
jgi:hypothetical protein